MTETQLIYVQQKIEEHCDALKALLLKKNAAYGNSAFEPDLTFARNCKPLDSIRIRIGDKLKRIRNGKEDHDEDTVLDLIGYLVLYRIGKELGLE